MREISSLMFSDLKKLESELPKPKQTFIIIKDVDHDKIESSTIDDKNLGLIDLWVMSPKTYISLEKEITPLYRSISKLRVSCIAEGYHVCNHCLHLNKVEIKKCGRCGHCMMHKE